MNHNTFPAMDAATAGGYSPLALAFIGDAVYETYVRTKILLKANMSANKLHREAVQYVRASAQSLATKALLPILNGEEESIYKRGRNAHSASVPKHADITEYRAATGFETLIGYLYLSAQTERVYELMDLAYNTITDSLIK
ncbi:MAG: Mini-ribonuclease 3 [Ruminococcaceae bacterium]|nr:Mini-ribonuclease 3 [Oscillospiraceae bacterium]